MKSITFPGGSKASLIGILALVSLQQPEQVLQLLMAGYLSAEQGRTIDFPPPGLDTFIPTVAQGTWKPARW